MIEQYAAANGHLVVSIVRIGAINICADIRVDASSFLKVEGVSAIENHFILSAELQGNSEGSELDFHCAVSFICLDSDGVVFHRNLWFE